jgi:hypothetical protein
MDQILTITDDTTNPILTEWKDAAIPINDYVQYDPLTEVFKRNFNLVITEINNLNLDYLNVASDLSVLGLTELSTTTINDNLTVAEITTTDDLVVDNNSIFKNGIGQTSTTLFKLPTNSPGPNKRLAILDHLANPITTEWQAEAPIINEYIIQDGETLGLKNVINGILSPIHDLSIRNIGYDQLNFFKLPTNTPTTGQLLSISDSSTSPVTTAWQDLPVYVSYNTSTNILSYNPSVDPPTPIETLRITSIGRGGNFFRLPTNTTTTPNYSRLVLADNVSGATEWRPSSGAVSYDTTTKFLRTESSSGSIPDITDISVTKIGSTNSELFLLPTNTSTSTAGQILSILNATTKTTRWINAPPTITNYTSYDTTSKVLINNVSGTTNITDLTVTKIGQAGQIFTLPDNTSSVSAGQILSILNASTKTTRWINAPPTITNYADYDNTAKTLISNVSSTPTTITDLAVSKIGATNAQIFSLPTNTSSVSAGQILSILNATTKTTQWINSPPIINNYMSYNTSTNQIINNVSGTSTISGLNIGNLTCNAIDTQNSTINCGGGDVNAGTITASVNLSSKGGIVVNNGTKDTCTIENTGQLICKNIIVRDPVSLTQYFTVNASGDVLGNSGDFSKLRATQLNIFNTLSAGVFETPQVSITNAGLLTCKGVDAGSGLIKTSGQIISTGGNVTCIGVDAGTGPITTSGRIISTDGNVTCIGVNAGTGSITTSGRIISTGGNVTCIGVDAGTGPITTSGRIISTSGNVTCIGVDAGTGPITTSGRIISTSGNVTCIGVNAGTGPITTSGRIISTGGNVTCIGVDAGTGRIKTTDWLDCANADISQTLYCRTLEIRNPTNDPIAKINTSGELTATKLIIGPIDTYFPYCALSNIGISTTGLITGANLTITPSIVTNYQSIGYSLSSDISGIFLTADSTLNSNNLAYVNIPNQTLIHQANYLVKYTIKIISSPAQTIGSGIEYGLGYYVSTPVTTLTDEMGGMSRTGSITFSTGNYIIFTGCTFFRYINSRNYAIGCKFFFNNSITMGISANIIRIC